MQFFRQFRLLLWKNFLVQIRAIWWTIFEIVPPLLLVVPTIVLGTELSSQAEKSTSSFDSPGGGIDDLSYFLPFQVYGSEKDRESLDFSNETTPYVFCFAPNTSINRKVMEKFVGRFSRSQVLKKSFGRLGWTEYLTEWKGAQHKGFPTEAKMVSFLVDKAQLQGANDTYFGGIVFKSVVNGANNRFEYKIRLPDQMRDSNSMSWMTDSFSTDPILFWTRRKQPHHEFRDREGRHRPFNPGYSGEGFLMIQHALNLAMMEVLSPKTANQSPSFEVLTLQGLPSPSLRVPVRVALLLVLPLAIAISFLFSVMYITRSIVQEKETRIREYMKVMGLSNWMHWVSHLVTNFIKLSIPAVVTAVLLSTMVVTNSKWFIVLLLLLLYAFGVILLAFAASTLFKSGNAATFFVTILWMVLIGLSTWAQVAYHTWSPLAQIVASLNINTPLVLGLRLIGVFDYFGRGAGCNNLFEQTTPDNSYTIGHALCILAIDDLLLVLFTWYVDAVNPGGEAVAQPPWFPFLPSYWSPSLAKKLTANKRRLQAQMSTQSRGGGVESVEEADPEGMEPSISLEQLSKTWGAGWRSAITNMLFCEADATQKMHAVKDVSVRMFPEQITALLGHNGAGKSTTFSMLSGMTPPTKGTAFINGYDIRNALPAIRKFLGLCPQYNVLIPSLTVEEHLKFFCQLKGQPFQKDEMMRLVDGLSLTPKLSTRSSALSGGMKRKLSLAIALIGGSKIVILDEPTSGMDPSARHETWTLLQKERAGRTMLLTTHYMEEADVLGDRIAILARGRLQCCGSSLFLKNHYGAGYHITMALNAKALQEQREELSNNILETLRLQCTTVRLKSLAGSEATFLLPVEYRPRFKEMFENLERNQRKLGIESFGVSVTTMEEVFLRVGQIADGDDEEEANENDQKNFDEKAPIVDVGQSVEETSPFQDSLQDLKPIRLTGFALLLLQLKATLIKRLLYFYRHWTFMIPQIIIPTLIFLGGILIASQITSLFTSPTVRRALPPLSLDLPVSRVPVAGNGTISTRFNKTVKSFGSEVENVPSAVSMNKFMHLRYAKLGVLELIKSYLVGGDFPATAAPQDNPTVFFNLIPYHSSAMAVNLMDTVLLRERMNNDQLTIRAVNHPLPPEKGADTAHLYSNSSSIKMYLIFVQGLFVAIALVLSYSLIAGSFAVFVVREKTKNVKHMQILTGLTPAMYWLSTILWDLFNFLLPIALTMLILIVFNIEAFIVHSEWLSTIIVLVSFAVGVLPHIYVVTFLFSSPTKAYLGVLVMLLLSGLISTILDVHFTAEQNFKWCENMENPADTSCRSYVARDLYRWLFFVLSPTFGLGRGASLIFMNSAKMIACRSVAAKCGIADNPEWHYADQLRTTCCGKFDAATGMITGTPDYINNTMSAFYEPGIGRIPAVFFLQFVVYVAVITVIEIGCRRCSSKSKNSFASNTMPLDTDVIDEIRRAATTALDDHPVLVRDVCKRFGHFEAVRGLSFAVEPDECFGLLGVNGAGKTTTFEMLVGKQAITSGAAFVNGHSILDGMKSIGQFIGYCPQFDAVLKDMTGEETLSMYARLRGVPERHIAALVRRLVAEVGIKKYAKKQIRTYSGGNVRKLSLAVALVALPDVLLLDEPTTGVDPASRRAIWTLLSKVRQNGTAIVLTSHSMEECEALCTRLGIMVAGQFRCIGSTQHIKHRFGSGYTLQLKLRDVADVNECQQAVTRLFPSSVLKECHHTLLSYEVRRTYGMLWSQMFDAMESLSDQMDIVDYSLSQTTLERVFLELSKENQINVPVVPVQSQVVANFNQQSFEMV